MQFIFNNQSVRVASKCSSLKLKKTGFNTDLLHRILLSSIYLFVY